MDLTKDTLRHEAVRHRDRINPTDVDEDPERACELFFEKIAPQKDQIIALYWPKGREFDLRCIIDELLKRGFTCALPIIQKDSRELLFAKWDEAIPLEKGMFDIQEPVSNGDTEFVEPDIICTPLLAFDRNGSRLGWGGGYYDYTLRTLRDKKHILAVGICYAKQAVIFNLPVEDHDEKLDWIITPQQALCFKS